MEPKLKAFLVSTQWGVKYGSVSIFVEYTAEMASASAVTAVLRQSNPPTENLTNLLVVEIEPAGLRTILTQLETGKPTADVVQLVQPAPYPPDLGPGPVVDKEEKHSWIDHNYGLGGSFSAPDADHPMTQSLLPDEPA